jgi:diguanylate cyclase (GGDEF)-like protein/PAS domain S-box-containing protein
VSALLALLAVLPLPARASDAAPAAAMPQFTLGVLAHRGKDRAQQEWQPTVDYLTRSLPGYQFRLLPLLLDETENAVAQRRVDFILTNPENYIVLEARYQVARNATLLQSHKGQPLKEFGGLIFTRSARKDLKTVADLRGRRIAGTSRNGFGGYQMQAYELMQAGIAPEDFTPLFVGLPQDKVVETVAQGIADAGFIRAGVLESLAAAGKIRLEDFRGIGLKYNPRFPFWLSTALYPEWAFATMPHVDDQLANRVTVALLGLPFGSDVARAGGYHGWAVPLSYNAVHDMMKALRAEPYNTPESFSIGDIARKYDRQIILVLLAIIVLVGYFTHRFARLNHSLGHQMALVAERGNALTAEVESRHYAERQLANENRVLDLLADEIALPQILRTVAQMCQQEIASDAGVAIFMRQDGSYVLAAADQVDGVLQQHWSDVPITASLVDDAAAFGEALGVIDRTIMVETIRGNDDAILGQLVALVSSPPRVPTALRPLLHNYAALAGMAIHRSAIGERIRLASSVFHNALEGIVVTDAFGRIVDISPSFTRLTGYARDEVIGHSMNLLKSGRHDAQFYREMWAQLLEHGAWSGEIWNRTRDGRIIAEILQISSVKDRHGQIVNFVGTFSDITSLKDAQAHLEKLASFDSLTGLPNRGLLADRLTQALSQTQRRDCLLAICFLDLDGFKLVNDTHGHSAGDALLREVARRLSATVRSGDTVARLGGDEFVLLLGDIKDVDELEVAVDRVLRTVAEPYDLGGRSAHISTSIGVTLFPLDDADADALLRHADQAMYRAKQDGRSRYHMFDTDYAAAHHERVLQRDRLRLAFGQQELLLHYQPRVSLREQHVEGVEALLRWRHPEKGLLAPASFLPDIEHDDLICTIGSWVLREALTQQRRWADDGVPLAVSVNVAARQFLDPRFMPNLEALLAEFPERPAGGLALEILETAAIEDIDRMAELIRQCHRLGVRFALDDFGTGYSSLAYLQRLPADILKIDRSFVDGMLGSRAGLAIVDAIVGLASAFQCELVAEGIETVEQGEMLARMGCGSGQGYVVSRPLLAGEVLPWIAAYRHPESWMSWGERGFANLDFPLLLAEFEHRCWIKDLIDATEGRPLTTSLAAIEDPTRCEFGRWLEQLGRKRYSRSPLFPEVDALHREVHALGHRIHGALGNPLDAKSQVPALRELSDRLVAALGRLQRGPIESETAT